jgi:hypothetical protein
LCIAKRDLLQLDWTIAPVVGLPLVRLERRARAGATSTGVVAHFNIRPDHHGAPGALWAYSPLERIQHTTHIALHRNLHWIVASSSTRHVRRDSSQEHLLAERQPFLEDGFHSHRSRFIRGIQPNRHFLRPLQFTSI